MRPRQSSIVALVALAFGLMSQGCSPRIDTHGAEVPAHRLAEILPGVHTRQDVAAILGSPSSVSMFGNEAWYYMDSRVETLAFFKPDVVERNVTVIAFDRGGTVLSVDQFGLERGREVSMVSRETPTRGSELTVIQQLVGNIGRFEGGEESQQRPTR